MRMDDGVSETENGAEVLRGLKGLALQATKPESSPEANTADSWESFERRGNEHFVAGKYDLAIAAYNDAIELKRKVAPLKEVADLLVKKAAAYFVDEKPIDAYWDCMAALNVQPGHLKATLRLAKALAALAKYEEARDRLVSSPYTTRPEFHSEISRMNRLVRESQNGEYDLKSMLKAAAASNTPRLDHADYNAGVREEWISEEKGNGLVALRDFAPGDLLLVCKAFMAAYATECEPATHESTMKECLSRIIHRISKNRDLVQELYRLFAGPEHERFDCEKCEAPADFDPGRVAAIVFYNSFESEAFGMIEGELQSFADVRHGFSFSGCGVWILASFMNHSCLPNTVNFFVGDIMFVRATKRVRKGDELTTSYVSSGTNYGYRRVIFDALRFKCNCDLCVCDLKRVTRQPDLEDQRDAFVKSFKSQFLQRMLEVKELRPTIMDDLRKWMEDFKSRFGYQNRYDPSVNSAYVTLGDCFAGVERWLKAAKAFEMALCAAVGKGTNAGDAFDYNSLTRNAFFLCFKIAHNYLLGRDFAKAKKFLAKAQTAARIAWGSADIELLKMLYPGLPIENIFKSLG